MNLPHVTAILGVSDEGRGLAVQKLTAWCSRRSIPLEYLSIEDPEDLTTLHRRIKKGIAYLLDGTPETLRESEYLVSLVKDSTIDSLLCTEILHFEACLSFSSSVKSPAAAERDARWISEREAIRRYFILNSAYQYIRYDKSRESMLTNQLAQLFLA